MPKSLLGSASMWPAVSFSPSMHGPVAAATQYAMVARGPMCAWHCDMLLFWDDRFASGAYIVYIVAAADPS
ncbi:hypothetical protein HJFPF1_06553 [Paramyrothecium foliicola]|nr:hypothetical protein HJFPF1_06553 [Paramyrothecium foliicola]